MENDIISAIATAPGEGGIGIVRISGRGSIELAEGLFTVASGKKLKEFGSHHAILGLVKDGTASVIDEAICIVMKAPHSYTCEDVVELQCHGSGIALREILKRTYELGARPAEPGEFTKRAFLNGRLDLSQAQAVMDIIRSRTDSSLRMATGHLSGVLSQKINYMRQEILGMIAHLEASIDFPEDDIEAVALQEATEKIIDVRNKIGELLLTANSGIILREGLKTAIVGKPNAGKSSIMNLLLREQRAIVTDVPGTTRDSIEEYVNIGGVPLVLVDTAGIRETDDVVEKIGVDRAKNCINQAGLILAVFDGSRKLDNEDREIIELIKKVAVSGYKSESVLADCQVIALLNKSDLSSAIDMESLKNSFDGVDIYAFISLSASTGNGLDILENSIVNMVYQGINQVGTDSFVSDLRQANLLRQSDEYLANCQNSIENGMSEDFVVIDLRAAWEALGEITGETVREDIIDQIFSKFCIGK